MKNPDNVIPADAAERRAVEPIACYSCDNLPPHNALFYEKVKRNFTKINEVVIPVRDAKTFRVPAGHLFRIVSIEGPQVGDLNLWNANDI